jgi:hypothetical protein
MIVNADGSYPINQKTGLRDNWALRVWAWHHLGYSSCEEYGPIPWRIYDAFKHAHAGRFNRATPRTVRFI